MAPPKKWNGQGDPPSHEAAIEWMVAQGYPRADVANVPRLGAGFTGNRAAHYKNLLKSYKTRTAPGYDAKVKAEKAKQEAANKAREEKRKRGDYVDSDEDGKVSDAEKSVQDDSAAAEAEAGPPSIGAGGNDRLLLPWEVGDDALVPTIYSKDTGERVAARYYTRHAMEPLKWDPPRIAELQDALNAIGLYGSKKAERGTWGKSSIEALTILLEQANVNGRKWRDQLKEWTIRPPVELLESLKGEGAVIRQSNPTSIRAVARATSKELLGRVDRGFVESSVAPVQAAEVAAGGAYSAATAGGGGIVTEPAAAGDILEERLRREKPIEVDGHAFVNQYQNFLKLLGPVV